MGGKARVVVVVMGLGREGMRMRDERKKEEKKETRKRKSHIELPKVM